MPTNKDFKRLVRGRMRKTGESYTTARMHLLQQTVATRPSSTKTVDLWFIRKGEAKAQVQVQHRKLPSKDAATRMKQYWEERLGALVEMLTRSRKRTKSLSLPRGDSGSNRPPSRRQPMRQRTGYGGSDTEIPARLEGR